MHCKDTGADGGIYVETFSGTSLNSQVCNLRNNSDVKHFVTVRSLKTYPVYVKCTGSIDTNEKKIRFDSTSSNGTVSDYLWQDGVSFKKGGERPYSISVALLSTGKGTGNAFIDTEIEVSSPQRQMKLGKLQLSFAVTV